MKTTNGNRQNDKFGSITIKMKVHGKPIYRYVLEENRERKSQTKYSSILRNIPYDFKVYSVYQKKTKPNTSVKLSKSTGTKSGNRQNNEIGSFRIKIKAHSKQYMSQKKNRGTKSQTRNIPHFYGISRLICTCLPPYLFLENDMAEYISRIFKNNKN